jgi:DNA repair protein RecO (recombination protein O)
VREHEQYKAGLTLLTLLRQFEKTALQRLGNVNLKPGTKLRLRAFMRGYMDTHIGVHLKSQQFLDQMDKYGLPNLDE